MHFKWNLEFWFHVSICLMRVKCTNEITVYYPHININERNVEMFFFFLKIFFGKSINYVNRVEIIKRYDPLTLIKQILLINDFLY